MSTFLGNYNQNYRIETDLYQGPLDLLLELIEKAELDITKLALAKVTDQYLAYLKKLEFENPSEVSSFLVIASKLLQIKSQALLPKLSSEILGADEEEDPGEALAQQLIIYKKFKEISMWLSEREVEGLRTYLRVAPPPKINFQPKLDLTGITLEDLITVANEIFANNQPLRELDSVINLPRVTIKERITTILDHLRIFHKSTFQNLLVNKKSRVELVVTFLALLELVKRHIIDANQPELFGEINLKSENSVDQNLELEIEFSE
ncbi:MAG TPA: segregation/condensation protein A [Anaerolineaceae bacterium]|nr:segregation/condensation protein A [Anaerolineaceae bacterium]